MFLRFASLHVHETKKAEVLLSIPVNIKVFCFIKQTTIQCLQDRTDSWRLLRPPNIVLIYTASNICFMQTDDVPLWASCPVQRPHIKSTGNNPLKKQCFPSVLLKPERTGTQYLPRSKGTFDDLLHLSSGDFQRTVENSKCKTLKVAISIFITMQSFLLYRSSCGSDS